MKKPAPAMDFLPLDEETMHALRRLARIWKTTPDKAAVRMFRRYLAERGSK
jgi:hypothetical protein